MNGSKLTVDAELEKLQHQSFSYFLHEANPVNGLVIDKTAADWPASIAATGLGLASYPVAVERGFVPRGAAMELPGLDYCIHDVKLTKSNQVSSRRAEGSRAAARPAPVAAAAGPAQTMAGAAA